MYLTERQIPFTTDNAYHGFAEIAGILRVEPKELLLEYQVKDSIMGLVKSGTKELTIPYSALGSANYKRTMFISRLQLRVNTMRVLGEFPASKDGAIELKIKRRYKEIAQDMEAYINLRIAEERLEQAQQRNAGN